MGSMKLNVKPKNTQCICEGVAVVCTHDAGDYCELGGRDEEEDTDHGCPSGGIKSGFSTTIEP